MSDRQHHDLDRALLGDAYGSREAMETLTVLCDDFGSRFGGTDGERKAAEYLRDKLEGYGLSDVRLEPFAYLGWRRDEARLHIFDPVERELPCISLPHSPAATISAELVDADDGAVATFDTRAAEMPGTVVMASSETYPGGSSRWIHRSEKYSRSLLNGAAAFIFMNHYPAYGPATGSVGLDGKTGLIPAVSVGYEDGAFLQRLLRRHGRVRLRLETTDTSQPMTSWNVIGDVIGAGGGEVVMLGSHYDGHDISQGAQDPASGVAAVLETARLLAAHATDLPHTLRFALWGVEEIGLLGSHAYAEEHQDELRSLRFYLNMDGAGATTSKGIMLHEWPELDDLFSTWRDQLSFDFQIGQHFHTFSDHYPFLLRGIPTGGIESVPPKSSGRGYGHTRYDTLDKVTTRELQDAAALASLIAVRLASHQEWPVTRRSQEELEKLFAQPEHAEPKKVSEEVGKRYEDR